MVDALETKTEYQEDINSELPVNPYNDIAQYRADMIAAEERYLDMIGDTERLYNVDVFNGLLSYIYTSVFKPDRRKKAFKHNAYCNFQTSILDYSDTDTLFDLWQLYKQICSRYQKTYTVHAFCCMTGISQQTFREWEKQNSRDSSKQHYAFCKAVKQDTESALYSKTVANNSIGSMFALKCLYQWNDQSPLVIRNESLENIDTVDDIAERHKLDMKPETPMIEE